MPNPVDLLVRFIGTLVKSSGRGNSGQAACHTGFRKESVHSKHWKRCVIRVVGALGRILEHGTIMKSYDRVVPVLIDMTRLYKDTDTS